MSFEAFLRIAEENQAKNDNKLKKLVDDSKRKKKETVDARLAIEEANKVARKSPALLSTVSYPKNAIKKSPRDYELNSAVERIGDKLPSKAVNRKRPTSLMDALEQVKAECEGTVYIPKDQPAVKVPRIPRVPNSTDHTSFAKYPKQASGIGSKQTHQSDKPSLKKARSPSHSLPLTGSNSFSNLTNHRKHPCSSETAPCRSKGKTSLSILSSKTAVNSMVKGNIYPEKPSLRLKSSLKVARNQSIPHNQSKYRGNTPQRRGNLDNKTNVIGPFSSKSGVSKYQKTGIVSQVSSRSSSQPPFINSHKITPRPSGIAAQFGIFKPLPTHGIHLEKKQTETKNPNHSSLKFDQCTLKQNQRKRPDTGVPHESCSVKRTNSQKAAPVSRGIAAQQGLSQPRGIAVQRGPPIERGILAQHDLLPARGIAAQFGATPLVGENSRGYDSEDDYASDDSFIDDTDMTSSKEYVKAVKEIHETLNFNPSKYARVSKYDDLRTMEASFRQIEQEEKLSLRLATREDEDDIAEEAERRRRRTQKQ